MTSGLYPVILVILLVTENIAGGGGMGITGKIRQFEITENSLFY